jgi:hypothetical protein
MLRGTGRLRQDVRLSTLDAAHFQRRIVGGLLPERPLLCLSPCR